MRHLPSNLAGTRLQIVNLQAEYRSKS